MFRLTRDIVDGFGPSGVEGTFRRCCEETMRVLRESKDDLLTILEVLTHDPLYNWSMTPEKAFKIQGGWRFNRIKKGPKKSPKRALKGFLKWTHLKVLVLYCQIKNGPKKVLTRKMSIESRPCSMAMSCLSAL